jgi:enamine deaminase RidA (YjgF/YER057c/UK114 family)
MAETAAARLKALGVTLPVPGAPQANYVPTVIVGNLIFVSGQISAAADGTKVVGKLGEDLTVDEGRAGARICAINILANLNAALGDLEKVKRMVKLTGFVNAVPDFIDPHLVINGCSDFLVDVLGERGRHARSAVGMATLPLNVAVEVEAIAEIA